MGRPVGPPCGPGAAGGPQPPVLGNTDGLAVASAICGFTAIVPVLAQVLGLGLGIASLVRIRRARRCGVHLRGRGWAWAGIASSGLLLLCWIVSIAALVAVGMVAEGGGVGLLPVCRTHVKTKPLFTGRT